jgi:flagellar capping protein FliD
MVKIPSFDDLKKAGTDFMDQARTSGISGVVDKIKSGMDSVTKADGTPVASTEGGVNNQIQALQKSLADVTKVQATQAEAIRKIDSQLTALSNAVAQPTTTETVIKEEEKKNL